MLRTDMTKLIVAFSNVANTPEKRRYSNANNHLF